MRKQCPIIVRYILVICLLLSLAACGGGGGPQVDPTPMPPENSLFSKGVDVPEELLTQPETAPPPQSGGEVEGNLLIQPDPESSLEVDPSVLTGGGG